MAQIVKKQYYSKDGEWVEAPPKFDKLAADKVYVNVAGDTMKGPLTVTAPSALSHAARWQDGLPRFRTIAERDAAYDAIGGPVEGMSCYVHQRQQQMSYTHADQWAAFGNMGAKGAVDYGVYGLPAGLHRYTMPGNFSAQGGIGWDTTENGFTLPAAGVYLVHMSWSFYAIPDGGGVQIGAGDTGARGDLHGSLEHPSAGAGGMGAGHPAGYATSIAAGLMEFTAAQIVCPWYFTSGGATLERGYFDIHHVSG